MRKCFLGDLKFPGRKIIGSCLVDIGDALLADVLDQGAIPDRLGAKTLVRKSYLIPGRPDSSPSARPSTISVPPSKSSRKESFALLCDETLEVMRRGFRDAGGSGCITIDCNSRPRPFSVPQFRGFREIGPQGYAVIIEGSSVATPP